MCQDNNGRKNSQIDPPSETASVGMLAMMIMRKMMQIQQQINAQQQKMDTSNSRTDFLEMA